MKKNKTVSITVESSFCAAHWHDKTLDEPLHAHKFNYGVTLTGKLNDEGFLVDFRSLYASLQELNKTLENKNLNEIFRYPTTENLAIYIFEEIAKTYPQITKVTVKEREGFSATYEG